MGFPFAMPVGKETICPFGCDNRDPSFGLRIKEGWYKCKNEIEIHEIHILQAIRKNPELSNALEGAQAIKNIEK